MSALRTAVSSDTRRPVCTAKVSRTPVAPSCPAPGGGRLQQRVGLVRLQEADERAVAALGRNREHPCDERGVLGMAVRGEGEPRAQRDQPGVAGGHAHAALFLKVGEEPADDAGVEVLEVELGRLLPAGLSYISPLGMAEPLVVEVVNQNNTQRPGLQLLCYRAGLPLSSRTLSTLAITGTRMPRADTSTICARRQATPDPLPRLTIRTSRPPSSSSISRTRTRSATASSLSGSANAGKTDSYSSSSLALISGAS